MKRLISIICVLAVSASIAAGCSKQEPKETTATATAQQVTQAQTTTVPETVTQTTTEPATQTTTAASTTAATTTAKPTTTKKETTTKKATTKKETTAKQAKGKANVGFKYKGVTFKPNAEMSEKMKKLANGAPDEATSCLGISGYDVSYSFDGAEITCYKKSKDAKEYIYEIHVTSGKLTNGVKIGDSVKSAKKTFGLKFKDDDGIYTYKKDGIKIEIIDDGESKVEEVAIYSTTLGK